ncbi:MAG: glycogen/starch synthase [Candidatus Onthomorpha sp.]|nr:glycogen/starch synthase [Bacteroidales bacterium]MDY3977898.1 glycogen/starch synthase [Candidatus Onthomorpha sp.]MCI5716063.1 glycogen/starch synthase [Bacteroidales bacterium]MCI6415845.1 glycogen/starch synthase [Bacteroidales bacterium]MCI6644720.1 glycogen/starch synthase [Bacteroidales bacterium]
MTKAKILFVNQEITPYLGEGARAEIGRFLPQHIQERGKEVRNFMPKFGDINERKNQLHEVIRLSGMNLIIDDTDHQLIIKVASIQAARMQIYFIDNDDFFQRKANVSDKDGTLFADNDERAIFFIRGVLETIKKLSWKPNIIHCSGWFAALLPFYVKRTEYKNNPFFSNSKVVLSLFNEDFEGSLCENLSKKMKADGGTLKDWKMYKEPTYLNLMKAAISYSDAVVIAEEGVNQELIDFAKSNKKTIIDYAPLPEMADSLSELYDKIAVIDED